MPVLRKPQIPDEKRVALRLRLLYEEMKELEDAIDKGSVVDVLDALTDIQYVLDGAYLEFGMGRIKQKAFDEVHQSNMSKLDKDHMPIVREDGKILKGPNYFPPNLIKVIRNA